MNGLFPQPPLLCTELLTVCQILAYQGFCVPYVRCTYLFHELLFLVTPNPVRVQPHNKLTEHCYMKAVYFLEQTKQKKLGLTIINTL